MSLGDLVGIVHGLGEREELKDGRVVYQKGPDCLGLFHKFCFLIEG